MYVRKRDGEETWEGIFSYPPSPTPHFTGEETEVQARVQELGERGKGGEDLRRGSEKGWIRGVLRSGKVVRRDQPAGVRGGA